ncbi:PspC domain-containing protein [Ornithinimicrobium pekingense]|uniref:Phage shock protein PspC N-terminal domain-containing protein n=1 Tax=Ornithinimicrobium pekingense TaxID=384677 RepID=A0ABQ2FBE1_9MICO|nr:PspC domain-containing protein [Ornithinimicrobium pekingense]GGK77826.1 hypothetical protein GCM10011509_27950 [Ornithinimicrobium pekingense]
MNETIPPTPATATGATSAVDDVWGVHRPPALQGQPAAGPSPSGPGPASPGAAPLSRDTTSGVVGGVCAGIARRTGLSPAAVRLAAVALVLFLGTGIGAYLILWALLPDDSGRVPAERAARALSSSGDRRPLTHH